MNTTQKSSKNIILRWLIVCLIPLLTIAYFLLNPADETIKHARLVRGAILACECVFLAKFVLFEVVSHHLKDEMKEKKQTTLLFIPLFIFALYICHFFRFILGQNHGRFV